MRKKPKHPKAPRSLRGSNGRLHGQPTERPASTTDTSGDVECPNGCDDGVIWNNSDPTSGQWFDCDACPSCSVKGREDRPLPLQSIHEQKALTLFGSVTPDNVAKAKRVNYAQVYGAGEIVAGRLAGRYPLKG